MPDGYQGKYFHQETKLEYNTQLIFLFLIEVQKVVSVLTIILKRQVSIML